MVVILGHPLSITSKQCFSNWVTCTCIDSWNKITCHWVCIMTNLSLQQQTSNIGWGTSDSNKLVPLYINSHTTSILATSYNEVGICLCNELQPRPQAVVWGWKSHHWINKATLNMRVATDEQPQSWAKRFECYTINYFNNTHEADLSMICIWCYISHVRYSSSSSQAVVSFPDRPHARRSGNVSRFSWHCQTFWDCQLDCSYAQVTQ